MKNQQIPAEYAWIKPGVKVRHVKMSADNMWIANELPVQTDGEWKVKIKDLDITVPCEYIMSEDDLPIYDSKGNFPDEMMGPFYTLERDDGFWECGHSGAGTATYGQTEKEAMKRFLMKYDMLTGHLIMRGMALSDDAETLRKARAVLAEHKDAIEWARQMLAFHSQENEDVHNAFLALADALEGGSNE